MKRFVFIQRAEFMVVSSDLHHKWDTTRN